ncbi:hypothetical protein JCM10207_000692 [Rhodosporidiobolus poonsookiae]
MAPSLLPVASTSRIPYSAPSPFSTAPHPRAFSSTSRTSSSARRPAHLIHPLVRQRLTNLTFAVAGLLSVATVSLGMSGSLGEGATPGCPARVRAGAAMQGERGREEEVQANQADRNWWKAKGRFLEDPLPISATAARPVSAAGRRAESAEAAQRSAEAAPREDGERIARPSARSAQEQGQPVQAAWQGWSGLNERVV